MTRTPRPPARTVCVCGRDPRRAPSAGAGRLGPWSKSGQTKRSQTWSNTAVTIVTRGRPRVRAAVTNVSESSPPIRVTGSCRTRTDSGHGPARPCPGPVSPGAADLRAPPAGGGATAGWGRVGWGWGGVGRGAPLDYLDLLVHLVVVAHLHRHPPAPHWRSPAPPARPPAITV